MSLNYTANTNQQKDKEKSKPKCKNKSIVNKSGKKRGVSNRDPSTSRDLRFRPKPKLKKPKLTLTEVHFDDFEIQKNKVQIRESDENNEEILHDAYVFSIKGEINFTYQFI